MTADGARVATFRVRRAGLLTTVQDTGRRGWQHAGVPEGGAMDDVALRVANLLVGNAPGEAALEVTLDGPVLDVLAPAWIAIGGADLGACVDGRPLAPWRAIAVPEGATITFGAPRRGCRAYLAVAGGLDVPRVLGSRATYVRAGLGGLDGRALRKGDELHVMRVLRVRHVADGAAADAATTGAAMAGGARRFPAPELLHDRDDETVRLVAGPALARLDDASRACLLGGAWRVSPQADRMGYRLEGPPLALVPGAEPLSAGVAFGTVQLPPGGAPIVLMADRQTTGGYPRLGEVATVDLPLLAQRRPGDVLRFAEISPDEAQALYLARERLLQLAAVALSRAR